MGKQKRNMADPVIAAFLLALILYLCLQMGPSWEGAKLLVQTDESANLLLTFLNTLEARISQAPLAFGWSAGYSLRFLLYGCLVWLVGVLYVLSTKKNYISGKEFGTAKWGAPSDLKDVQAGSVLKEELKKARRARFALGRFLARRKACRDCEEAGSRALQQKKQLLEGQLRAGTLEKSQYRTLWAEAKSQGKREVEAAKLEAWKPKQLKAQYQERLQEIAALTCPEEEKAAARQEARRIYLAEQASFRSGTGKVEGLREKYRDADMLLTKTEQVSLYNFKLNNNTLILGGSGSGKTRGYVMPNLLQAHASYVITDPKGEILEKSGHFLREVKGYKIRVLNLDEKAASDCYNPFVYIHPERAGYEERVMTLIETIIVNTNGGEKKGSTDPFWDKAERLFLQALFFFTVDGFVKAERNMNTLMELIAMLKIEEEQDLYDSDLDYFAQIFAEKHGSDHIGYKMYQEFRQKASGKTAKSIVISAVSRLAPFQTPAVGRIFSHDTMELDRIGEEKMALFVVVPPTDKTFNFIAGMLFTQLFQEIQHCATQVHKQDGKRLPVPCRFLLDEFANTCIIPNFVNFLAYARSFGVGIVPILQSLEQIKVMYKDEWGVIVDNCSTLLYLGSITHMETLKYMSELLGKGTFDKRTTGRTRGRQGSTSQNFDVVGRELMTPDEIRKLEKEKCLLIVSGRNPFLSHKLDYTTHPNYRYTSDASAAYSFAYTPHQDVTMPPKVLVKEDAAGAERPADEIQLDRSHENMMQRLGSAFEHMAPVSETMQV